ncbi:energy-coupling factor transporter ATPase [Thermoanaerobacter sp. CM-CNRG TB177]|jgi:energy-coupling factor transport system ATP-binding protein|uniref:Energy-coupling factor transporter ATP-binding protein EcfA2 n=2 Tax=Thermoanaerobacter TaxID=1754 RepID=B0KCN1_THEP3|nr:MULTISPECIES: energy-coupling factor transporter ATPase [Thermoanaerobacter]ABY92200.1 ABC transporter related [Thermoanaerobacter sp. X514]ABY94074.1 ABC transporter related [Thermoanaerobacter pseudethanolicus ATCC 33223]ADV79030.1 ABC transporter related protein [Thermoanaerobacter brockii subsp. finnii Ako-1]MBT1278368.1 energy-coupling factor transporter ATPase [Thermoanaerobacter sp. CM-CNRG TB177]MBZ4655697.1 transporter related protein [Thermoanaerobacter sp.]
MPIKVENLSFVYNEGTPYATVALNNVTFEIQDEEFVGIIGHTGSGKSTLIQHLNGLLKPTSGKIYINGVDITDKKVSLKDVRKEVGLVFQYPEYQLFEETIFKDIAFGPTNLGLSEEEIEKRVYEAMDIVGISRELADKSPFEVSGGQKRRIAIAGILAMKPKILILDEPTAGLDPKGKEEILNKIKEIHDKYKMITILVSHSMEDIARFADKIIVMNKGRIEVIGTPREVFREAEKLEKIGLGVPQITSLARELQKKGVAIPEDILTIEEAKEYIVRYLRGTKNV